MYYVKLNILKILIIYSRERARAEAHVQGWGGADSAEGEGEGIPNQLHTEPAAGISTRRPWPELKSRVRHATN